MPANPRSIKRIINAIELRKEIAKIEGHNSLLGTPVRWTILEQSYPEFTAYLISNPSLITTLTADTFDAEKSIVGKNHPDWLYDCVKQGTLLALLKGNEHDDSLDEKPLTEKDVYLMGRGEVPGA